MPKSCKEMICPTELAFDIDGVVADTMAVFVRLAHERYGLAHLSKEDMHCYNLYSCLNLASEVIDDLICLTLDDEHTLQIPPMPMAPDVLTDLAGYGPLRFVTARIWPESIMSWLHQTLPLVDPAQIQVIATGSPEAKLNILRELRVHYFVEDRMETCHLLAQEGIQPLLYDQPWNREPSEFPRFMSWFELKQVILPENGKHQQRMQEGDLSQP